MPKRPSWVDEILETVRRIEPQVVVQAPRLPCEHCYCGKVIPRWARWGELSTGTPDVEYEDAPEHKACCKCGDRRVFDA